ncbi:MAG: tetratricopeptide repeat protein [Phycisphaerae bacterium]
MKRMRRAAVFGVVAAVVLAAGCGPTQLEKTRAAARERWATSRAEIATKLAQGCFERGELGRARDHLQEALKGDPPYAPVYLLAARLAVEKGEFDDARRYAEAARALEPEAAEIWYVLGTVHQTFDQPEEALAAFTEAARLDPDNPAYALAQVEFLIRQGRVHEAEQRLGEAVGRTPGRAELQVALGDLLGLLGRHEESAGSYRIAMRLAPKRQDVAERLATALFLSGAYDEAEPLLENAAERDGKETPAWVLRMWGESLLATGRVREARPVLERVLEKDAGALGVHVALAKCDILENQPASARRRLDKVLSSAPDHAEANALMGLLLMHSGRAGEAVPHLRLALAAPDCGEREALERLLARARSGAERSDETDGGLGGASP